MSRSICVVATGLGALQTFATALVGKATANGVSVDVLESCEGAHTAVTRLEGAGSGAYKGVTTTLVRAVLPTGDAPTPLRDAVDVLPAAGIACTAEVAAVKQSFQKTAQIAVAAAKASGNKITLAVKQQSKFNNLNTLFQEVVTEAAEGTGVSVEAVGTAQVSNTMIMFPEQLGVVATADTPAAENIEGMFAGVIGGAPRHYHCESCQCFGGSSAFSVASACAKALSGQGMSAEAKKIEAALAKAKPNDTQSILSNL